MNSPVYLINKFTLGMLATRELNAEMETLSEQEFVKEISKHGNLAAFSDPRIEEELGVKFHGKVKIHQNRTRRFFAFKPEDKVILVERNDRSGELKYFFTRIKVKQQSKGFFQRLAAAS